MKKFIKSLIALSLSLSLLLAACDGGTGKQEPADVKLWSVNALEKIMRDAKVENYAEAKLSFELAQNETEGAQFLISPQNGYKVENFTVEITDAVDGEGNVISSKNFEVYLQKYIYVDQYGSCPGFDSGFVPDALLPFEKAVEYGENNVQYANQGIYVTVKTTDKTKAGEYSGACKVNIDGSTFTVPVSVTVWDFAVPEENHVGSLFPIGKSQLMYGEMNATDEMYEAYYNFLADYRLSANNLPYSTGATPEEYVTAARKAYNDKRISSFALPYRSSGGDLDYDYVKSYVKALVLASEKEAELLDKATYYFGSMIDEPKFNGVLSLANKIGNGVTRMEEELIEELTDEGFFKNKTDVFSDNIKAKIRNIPNVLTSNYDDLETSDIDFTYSDFALCPLFDDFDGTNAVTGDNNATLYSELKEESGNLWWYGCTNPCYPYPTYHIDDYLLGARVVGTMMHEYGVDGNLYWSVNYYSNTKNSKQGDLERPSDTYNDYYRHVTAFTSGDGYLIYPGVDYGINGPVGSLRLEAIRDGNEDYEYYYVLDGLAETLSDYYKANITTNAMVSGSRGTLYNGTQYIADSENFYEVRREVARTISLCSKDVKFVLNGITVNRDTATVEFFVNANYSVTVNGQSVEGTAQGQGKKYTYSLKLENASNAFNIVMKNGDAVEEVSVLAGGKAGVISLFDSEEEVSKLSGNNNAVVLSYNEDIAYVTGETGGSVKAEITSTFDSNNPVATLSYNPRVTLNLTSIGLLATNLDAVTFNVYNATEMKLEMRILLATNSGLSTLVSTETLVPGLNSVKISAIYNINWSALSSANSIVFEFNNTVDNKHQQAMPKQTLYFDEMLYTEKIG